MTLKISNTRLNKFDARTKLAKAIDTASYFTVNLGPRNTTSGRYWYICTLPVAATFVSGKAHLTGDEGQDMVSVITKGATAAALSGGTAISAVATFDAGAAALEDITALSTGAEDCSAGDNIVLDNTTNAGNNVFAGLSLTFKLVDDPTRS